MILFGFLMNALVTEIVNSYSEIFSAYSSLVVFSLSFMEFYPVHTQMTIRQQIPSFYSSSLVLQIPAVWAFTISDLYQSTVLCLGSPFLHCSSRQRESWGDMQFTWYPFFHVPQSLPVSKSCESFGAAFSSGLIKCWRS